VITPYDRRAARQRRHRRIRKKVHGTATRPRLSVFRSHQHMYAQVVDDEQGHTLASASTLDPELRERVKDLRPTQAAFVVGEVVAQRALARGIRQVVFDRGGYLYHGRVAALADGARKGGLEF
jgi:large subunit ribosomal protein L18